MEVISLEWARIHAHLCGDGYTCIWKTRQKGRKFTAITGYCNKNQKLLDQFRIDFSKIFGVKMKMRRKKGEVSISSIRIHKEIRDKFGDFGSKKWRIPQIIKCANKEVRLNWLVSFFEDEAYHEKRYDRLKTKSVNLQGLNDAKELLESLNIFCTLTGPNCDSTYYLTIPKFSSVKEFNNFSKEPVRKVLKVK